MKINKRREKMCFSCGNEGRLIFAHKATDIQTKHADRIRQGLAIQTAINRAVKTNRTTKLSIPPVWSCCGKSWVPNKGIKRI